MTRTMTNDWNSLTMLYLFRFTCNIATDWFSSYLSNRSFRVQLEAARSKKVKIGPYGVPQGTVLGSTLFIISENDLPEATPDKNDQQTVMYVDDSNDQVAATTPRELMSKLQLRADNIISWLEDNRMIISPAKTKLLVMATPQLRSARAQDVVFSVKVGDTVINATPSERMLGLTVSQDMTWLPHFWGEMWRTEKNITGLIPELLRRVGLLKNLARLTSTQKMRTLVPGIFNSKLSYGLQVTSSIWGLSEYGETEMQKVSFTREIMMKLQSIQRQAAITMCPNMPIKFNTPTSEILNNIGMLSIHQKAAMMILKLALRVIRTKKPHFLASNFITTESRGRAQVKLKVPRLRLNISHEGFLYQSIRLINKLPQNILDEASLSIQRRMLFAWVKDNVCLKP